MTFSSDDDDLEHSCITRAPPASLKKSIAPLLHKVLFLISAGIGPFLHEKCMGISSRHNGSLCSFSPATAGSLARRSKCSLFHSLFYAEKGPFSRMS